MAAALQAQPLFIQFARKHNTLKKTMIVHVLRIKISNECHKPHLGTKVKTMGSNRIQNTHPSMVEY